MRLCVAFGTDSLILHSCKYWLVTIFRSNMRCRLLFLDHLYHRRAHLRAFHQNQSCAFFFWEEVSVCIYKILDSSDINFLLVTHSFLKQHQEFRITPNRWHVKPSRRSAAVVRGARPPWTPAVTALHGNFTA